MKSQQVKFLIGDSVDGNKHNLRANDQINIQPIQNRYNHVFLNCIVDLINLSNFK